MSEEWAIATNSMDEYTEYQNAMAEATDKANTAEARAQAQAAAGVFRRNYYISLMENFNDAVRISDELINAEGHSMAENGRYMETLTAKVEQLITALTEFAVTAADAGLLDFAKNIIDVTNQIVRLTSENGTLIPSLISLAGVFLTIRSADVAKEIGAIANSFGNAVTAIRNVATAATAADASMRGAAAGAITLNSALGAIGLAVTGISLVVSAIVSMESKIHDARMEAIKAGDEASKQFDTLTQLKSEYDELSTKVKRTAEEESRYYQVQDVIIESLGIRASALYDLEKGTSEYNQTLQDTIETELKLLRVQQELAVEAARKEYKGIDSIASQAHESGLGESWSPANLLVEKGLATQYVGSYGTNAQLKMGGDIVSDYAVLEQAMKELNLQASELANTNTKMFKAFTTDEFYVKVTNGYNKIKDGAEAVIKAETELAQTKYILNNSIPKTVEEQKAILCTLAADKSSLIRALLACCSSVPLLRLFPIILTSKVVFLYYTLLWRFTQILKESPERLSCDNVSRFQIFIFSSPSAPAK